MPIACLIISIFNLIFSGLKYDFRLKTEDFKDLTNAMPDSPISCQVVVDETLDRVKKAMAEGGVLKPGQTLRDYCNRDYSFLRGFGGAQLDADTYAGFFHIIRNIKI